ncbi:hypothetical protein B0H13DRAFT_2658422 [Mycena leptocephala]|nr:hypothetical protein B0H13DRAFT_2658422 [Mycena leptocephala]
MSTHPSTHPPVTWTAAAPAQAAPTHTSLSFILRATPPLLTPSRRMAEYSVGPAPGAHALTGFSSILRATPPLLTPSHHTLAYPSPSAHALTASIVIAATGILAVPNTGAKPNMAHAEEDLTEWFKSSVLFSQTIPAGKPAMHNISTKLSSRASFGLPKYNYSSLMGFYGVVNQLIAADGYNPFTVEFTSITIDPNADDAGGIAVVTGLVKGYKDGALVASATDGLFATISIVNGERKYTEW